MELETVLKLALVPGIAVVGGYFGLSAFTYLVWEAKYENRVKKAMSEAGISDSTGLIAKILKLQARSFSDEENERFDGSKRLTIRDIPVISEVRAMLTDIPRMTYANLRFMVDGYMPNWIRVYLGEPENENYNVKLEIETNYGTKTDYHRVPVSQRMAAIREVNLLKPLGYPVQVFA